MAALEPLDDGRDVGGLFYFFVVVRKQPGVNWLSEDLGVLLLHEFVDH